MYNSVKEMNILETQYKLREFDGMWEKLVKVLDFDNAYHYTNENGNNATLIPHQWICVDVLSELPTGR